MDLAKRDGCMRRVARLSAGEHALMASIFTGTGVV